MINFRFSQMDHIVNWYVENIKLEYQRFEWPGTRVSLWNLVNIWLKRNLDISFEDLLRANHSVLQQKKNLCLNKGLNKFPAYIYDIRKTYDKFASINDGIGRKNKADRITAFDLIEKIGNISCPYCNKTQIENRRNIEKRTSQLDHFFNKDKFPFLSLSIHNLIPSCGACNHIKLAQDVDASPYDWIDISNLSVFDYEGIPGNVADLEIKFTATGVMLTNEEVFDLQGSYNNNVENLNNLLLQINHMPVDYFASLENHPGILTKARAMEVAFDTVLRRDHFYTKPLSKFKYDILKKIFHELR